MKNRIVELNKKERIDISGGVSGIKIWRGCQISLITIWATYKFLDHYFSKPTTN
jgi:hypothetical protein